MKGIALMLLAAFVCGVSCAQKITADKVPSAVTSAFKSKYANATKVTWEMEGADYEAGFTQNNSSMSTTFDKTGKWLMTEAEIKVSELPEAVRSSIEKQLAGFKINEAERIESAKYGNGFKVEVEKGEETWDVIISPEGKVLSKTSDEDEDEEEDDDQD